MAVITKKVGNRSYSYLSVRRGPRVVQRYLGPVGDPETERRASVFRQTTNLPDELIPLFWDARPEDIRLQEHSAYIIERVLELGGLKEMGWIQKIYPTQRVLQVLATSRALSAKSRNFWGLWFGHPQ